MNPFSENTMTGKAMPPPPISIVGAGFSGLVLGQCLRRQNTPAVIYERVKANPTRNNYGITLHSSTYKPLLDTLAISEQDFRRQVAIHHPDNNELVSNGEKLRVNRAALTRLLQEGLDIRWEHRINSITASAASRSVSFGTPAGNQTQDYSLLIGADGVHSATRSLLKLSNPAFDLKVLPYIVFNGKRRIAYSALPSGLLDCFTKPEGITHTQGDAVLTIKADFWDADKQLVAVSYTLSRPAGEKDQPLLDRNISDAETLAKCFVDEVAALGEIPGPFGQVFNPETMSEDRLLHWLMRSSSIESKAIEKLATETGVVLLGDAVHAQQILSGNGANLAITDALEFAGHINSSSEFENMSGFLEARAQTWAESRRETEQSLQDMHDGGNGKARI